MPLRAPRLVRAVAVIALTSAPVAALAMPAYASPTPRQEWWLGKLHVTQAWRSTKGAGVTVAILADGVDAQQADLSHAVVSGPDFTQSGRKPGGPHYGVIGTGLASVIVGHGHGRRRANGQRESGILGVAEAARVLSVRVTLSPGDPLWADSKVTSRLPDAVAAGIRYAVLHGATVIDLPPDPGLPGIAGWGNARSAAGGSAAESAAVAFAASRNVVLVAPAGDNARSGDAVAYPAAYPAVISVGAVNRAFVESPFSSRQAYVTLAAPGQAIVAASPSGYQTLNGTWAASAITSGIAALVWSQFPSLTAAQVRTAMTHGTVNGRSGGQGNGPGILDAARSIGQAGTMTPPHAIPAGYQALPKNRPETPATPAQGSQISHDLITDGEISAGILVALLVPITWYGTAARRRDRRAAAEAALRERQSRSQAGSSGMLADPLLEFFGPQHARPAEPEAQRAPVTSRYQPRPALTGRSTLSARAAGSPGTSPRGRPLPEVPVSQAADPIGAFTATDELSSAGSFDAGDPAGLAPPADPHLGPRSQAGLPIRRPAAEAARAEPPESSADAAGLGWGGRPAQFPVEPPRRVSGAPPWEPAPQPTTALPWAAVPDPPAGTAPRARFTAGSRPEPPESVWDDPAPAGAPARRSLFEPASYGPDQADRRTEAAYPQPATWQDLPAPGAAAGRSDTGGHPIYVWNPATSSSRESARPDAGVEEPESR